MSGYEFDIDDVWRFFAIVNTRDGKPLLERDAFMQLALATLQETVTVHQSQLWGYVILPDSVQFVVEVPTERTYHVMIEAYKKASEQRLITEILDHHSDRRDDITYFNPAWTKPIHLIWQNGYQTQLLSSVYAMSNKIADLVQKPVELGFVDDPAAWAFSSYRGDHEEK